MLLKRGTGIRKGGASTRNDKMKKMGAKQRRCNEVTVRIWLKLCFVSIFHFSRSSFPVLVTSSFVSVEYPKYFKTTKNNILQSLGFKGLILARAIAQLFDITNLSSKVCFITTVYSILSHGLYLTNKDSSGVITWLQFGHMTKIVAYQGNINPRPLFRVEYWTKMQQPAPFAEDCEIWYVKLFVITFFRIPVD